MVYRVIETILPETPNFGGHNQRMNDLGYHSMIADFESNIVLIKGQKPFKAEVTTHDHQDGHKMAMLATRKLDDGQVVQGLYRIK